MEAISKTEDHFQGQARLRFIRIWRADKAPVDEKAQHTLHYVSPPEADRCFEEDWQFTRPLARKGIGR